MTDEADAAGPRQRVVRVRGSRRAQLTPAPDTDPAPEAEAPDKPVTPKGSKGPNDDRLIQDVPPHY